MEDVLTKTKGDLKKTLETLKSLSPNVLSDDERREAQTRLQMAQNAIVQNERKIWLRTKDGKEMIGGFSTAALKLTEVVDRLKDALKTDEKLLSAFREALGDVDLSAKRLEEESRRRSMVVT